MINPLLQDWDTPYGVPPFHLIKTDNFKPAIVEAIRTAALEIERITENPELPSFENSVAELDRSCESLIGLEQFCSTLTVQKLQKSFSQPLRRYLHFWPGFQMM
jgi:peptidyl-dipeptidase Dcp